MKHATAIGAISIFLWGTLALVTVGAAALPPFQLLAITFTIAFVLTGLKWAVKRQNPLDFFPRQPGAWLLGVTGLFGYHFLYSIALNNAPAAEAGLIAYFWPLLIVLFSTLLPEQRLTKRIIVGALLAVSGCLIMLWRPGIGLQPEYLLGYLAAIGCAFIWSGYSVLSRLYKSVPTDAIGMFCGLTALLAWVCHILLENSIWPSDTDLWLNVLLRGVGPVGIAFFTWDYGMKHGDIQLLGVLAYATPVISTLLLIWAGQAQWSTGLILACLLIVSGSVIASLKNRDRKPQS